MAWAKPRGKYPKEWDRIKRDIYTRSQYKCEARLSRCLKEVEWENWRKGHYDAYGPSRFRVHHIDCNKSNNDYSNLLFVCEYCHGELHAEINRKNNAIHTR